jgi:hypothetical protein
MLLKIDGPLIVIILIALVTATGFAAAAINYNSSEFYPPWVHANTNKPALLYVPVINGTTNLSASLYDAYGNLIVNLTQVSSNASYVEFSTGSYQIHTNYAYKVWVPQQNIVYDFGLQNPSIGELKDTYYHVILTPTMQDQYWRPTS